MISNLPRIGLLLLLRPSRHGSWAQALCGDWEIAPHGQKLLGRRLQKLLFLVVFVATVV